MCVCPMCHWQAAFKYWLVLVIVLEVCWVVRVLGIAGSQVWLVRDGRLVSDPCACVSYPQTWSLSRASPLRLQACSAVPAAAWLVL